MKKLSKKSWERDVRFGIDLRKKHVSDKKKPHLQHQTPQQLIQDDIWINENIDKYLNITIKKKYQITLNLPEKMNFSDDYESTSMNIAAIRKLSNRDSNLGKVYLLKRVNIEGLATISTSAALVLTAELSKWDDYVKQKIQPMVDNWNPIILSQFYELGFFNLFRQSEFILEKIEKKYRQTNNPLHLVQYIKGRCDDPDKAIQLKQRITKLVGQNVKKWTFLHSGLSEAITNVSHHAYPEHSGHLSSEKNWYLTGSFNEQKRILKIVFYDQGIGIPNSLPESDIWEKVLKFLDNIPYVDRKKDEVLLKAAVQLDRTSTGQSDRGKGLQDLLEFINQRKNGYISILSSKGLYKHTMTNGKKSVKTIRFLNPIHGTLIIWCATLS